MSSVSYVMLKGEMAVTVAALHVVKSIEHNEAEVLTLEHVETSNERAEEQDGELTAVMV